MPVTKIFTAALLAVAIFTSCFAQSAPMATLPQASTITQGAGTLPAVSTANPVAAVVMPTAPDLNAKSFILVDMTAGNQILTAKNVNQPLAPASLTKLMTAYLTFQALANRQITLNQTFTVGDRAWKAGGSTMFLQPNMQVPVEDLLKGMIVQSGNDAAMTLAQGVGGSITHFVEMMNTQAKALGMVNTQFKNPDGLPEAGHQTTAQDLAILVSHIISDYPKYFFIFKIKNYFYPGTPTSNSTNRNTLLFRDPSVDGMKTGYTSEAGYCLIGAALHPDPSVAINDTTLSGRRIISVVLGTPTENDRVDESQKLLNWGYSAYRDVKLFNANQSVSNVRVWKGKVDHLPIGSTLPIVVSVPSGNNAPITTKITMKEPMMAPIANGQQVAMLQVYLGSTLITSRPLYALQDNPIAGVFGRLWDGIRLWFK